MACQLAYSRPARPDELKMLMEYRAAYGLANVCRLIYNSNEFMFVD